MVYQETSPPADLASHIACFWCFLSEPTDPEAFEHTIPPDGTASLAWLATSQVLVLVGPRNSAMRVQVTRGAQYFGMRFRPGATESVLGMSGQVMRDQRIVLAAGGTPIPGNAPGLAEMQRPAVPAHSPSDAPVANAAGSRIEALLTALRQTAPSCEWMAAAMADHVRQWLSSPPDPVVSLLVDRLVQNGDAEVQDLISDVGLSYRQVLRRFKHAVGLTPKEFLRLRRVRNACLRVVEAEAGLRWAEISAESGFADQSHLTREFGRAFGWPPSLVAAYLRQIEHSGVRP